MGLALVLVWGCAETQPSTFYTLSSLRTSAMEPAVAAGDGPAVGVGPISLPEYVNRPQIVLRASPNRLALAEFDKWAEPVEDMFSRVLIQNLSALLNSDRVMALPRRRGERVDVSVELDISQFDANAAGEAILAARWTILKGGDRDMVVTRSSVITDTVRDANDYEAVVAAMSRTVEGLSRDIAAAISAVR